jgi:5-formyltetrahydrofolate cyclo-ligase
MTKEDVRMRIWCLMEEKGISAFPKPIIHRIPNFVGAEKAAQRVRGLPEYRNAKVIFCNPDAPQRPLREIALRDNKIVIMATPRLRNGFLKLDPQTIPRDHVFEISTIHGAFKCGQPIEPSKVKTDLFVAGSVAVSLDGGRLGKGKGYSDQEYAILKKAGSLSQKTVVVTTVHDLQIVEVVPRDEWDIPVDIIVTPSKVMRIRKDSYT